MSKMIAFAAIRGAHNIVPKAEAIYKGALEQYGPEQKMDFPNTAYYLPIIYSMTGHPGQAIGDAKKVFDLCPALMPPPLSRTSTPCPTWPPCSTRAWPTFFVEEMVEAIRYLETPTLRQRGGPGERNIWLGAASDLIFRKRGVEFVDGTAPGFAAIVGAAPDPQTAAKIALELQEKNLYVFMCGENNRQSASASSSSRPACRSAGPRAWSPSARTSHQAVFAIGFACRVAMAFGGIKPGDFRKILIYNKDRTYRLRHGPGRRHRRVVRQRGRRASTGASPPSPTRPSPRCCPRASAPTSTWSPMSRTSTSCEKAVEVRGLKVQVTKVPIPVSYGAAFEGERVAARTSIPGDGRRQDPRRRVDHIEPTWTTSRTAGSR